MIQDISSIHLEKAIIKEPIHLLFLQKVPPIKSKKMQKVIQPFVPEFYENTPKKRANQESSRLQVSISQLGYQNTSFAIPGNNSLKSHFLEMSTIDENPLKHSTIYENEDFGVESEIRDLDGSNARSFLEVSNRFFPANNESIVNEHISFLLDKKNGDAIFLPTKKLTFFSLKLKHSVHVIGSRGSILEFKSCAFRVLKTDCPKKFVFSEINFKVLKNSSFIELTDKSTEVNIGDCFIKGSRRNIKQGINKPENETNEAKLGNLDVRKMEFIKSRTVANWKRGKEMSYVIDFGVICGQAEVVIKIESSIVQSFSGFLGFLRDRSLKKLVLICEKCSFSYFDTFMDFGECEVEELVLSFENCKINNMEYFLKMIHPKSKSVSLKIINCDFSNVNKIVNWKQGTHESTINIKDSNFCYCGEIFYFESFEKIMKIESCLFFTNSGTSLWFLNCPKIILHKNNFFENSSEEILVFENSAGKIGECKFEGNLKTCLKILENWIPAKLKINKNEFLGNLGTCILFDKNNSNQIYLIEKNHFRGQTIFLMIENFGDCEVLINKNKFETEKQAVVCKNNSSKIEIKNNLFGIFYKNKQSKKEENNNFDQSFFKKSGETISPIVSKKTQLRTNKLSGY